MDDLNADEVMKETAPQCSLAGTTECDVAATPANSQKSTFRLFLRSVSTLTVIPLGLYDDCVTSFYLVVDCTARVFY